MVLSHATFYSRCNKDLRHTPLGHSVVTCSPLLANESAPLSNSLPRRQYLPPHPARVTPAGLSGLARHDCKRQASCPSDSSTYRRLPYTLSAAKPSSGSPTIDNGSVE